MSSPGDFATARRSHIGEDAAFIVQKLSEGVPEAAVARMTGRALADVQVFAKLVDCQPPAIRAAYAPPTPVIHHRPMRVLSLWRGEMLISNPNTPKSIKASVAHRHGITVEDLEGPLRSRKYARARQEAMWELRERLKLSFPRIGQLLGGRDHTTAMWGYRAHQARMCGEARD